MVAQYLCKLIIIILVGACVSVAGYFYATRGTSKSVRELYKEGQARQQEFETSIATTTSTANAIVSSVDARTDDELELISQIREVNKEIQDSYNNSVSSDVWSFDKGSDN
ncbi:MAG: hypothetical protein LBU55_01245 [Elusimicrobiota bacterium]|jgi:Tfp pilus assembly protein PilO|nr:hypothetical protein [Elusimicrobiota bacterium]